MGSFHVLGQMEHPNYTPFLIEAENLVFKYNSALHGIERESLDWWLCAPTIHLSIMISLLSHRQVRHVSQTPNSHSSCIVLGSSF